MNINDIIEIGSVDQIESRTDSEKYIFSIIIMLVSKYIYDYCLKLYNRRWTSLCRIANEVHMLPEPPVHEIDRLLDLLTDTWPQPMYTADFGGFSKTCIFSLNGDLVMCFFAYEDGAEQRSISMRLVYGATAPSAAGKLVSEYRRLWE